MTDTERALISNLALNIMSGTLNTQEIYDDAKQVYELSQRPVWTPCSEGMPKARSNDQSDDVLICYINKHGTLSVSTGWYWSEQEHWYQTNSDVPINVIAWQPLPEPYNPNKAQEARADG